MGHLFGLFGGGLFSLVPLVLMVAALVVMAEYRTSGFSTYGEQYDDFHMNQTMVGVAFGGPALSGPPVSGD